MKQTPILYCGEMVREILEDRKTQTRRIIKPQPPFGCSYAINGSYTHALCFADNTIPPVCVPPTAKSKDHRLLCPYGTVGDHLWVKETYRCHYCHCTGKEIIQYRADDPNDSCPDCGETLSRQPWKPSIFMRRIASRITLEITSVRVERLKDITPADSFDEGIQIPVYDDNGTTKRIERISGKFIPSDYLTCKAIEATQDQWAVAHYASLWESINGKGSWAKNSWVWVILFKRVQ
jgi:hypothetical protein